MLMRMYIRWAEARDYEVEEMDRADEPEAGIRSATLRISGPYAFGYLKAESGVHRLVRISPFDSQARRHTAFASVDVSPEADDSIQIELDESDIKVDTMRAGGAGGQHVNKTESAVRIVHLPTNTTVVCMDEKSQHKNRAQAMRILRTRLYELERKRIHDKRAAERKEQVGTGDRSARIRTYNFPQNRCSDHRLGQNYSLEQIMSGRLGPLLEALEERDREERIKNL
jgi:protein subunit release factor A